MFDRLIESDSEGADTRSRRRIFAAAFVFVTILLSTALVAGIYAVNFDIGSAEFDTSALLSPVPAEQPQPKPPEKAAPGDNTAAQGPTRTELIASTDDPRLVPTDVSTEPQTVPSISADKYLNAAVGPVNSDPQYGVPKGRGDSGSTSSSRSDGDQITRVEPDPVDPPPPAVTKPKSIVTSNVINGKATLLPRPNYPPAAIALNLSGSVSVQVTIDEGGKVIAAKAVGGHYILRGEAEKAAWKARFSTTYLTGVPVKVTGVIVYNFKR